jgi:histidyl-tRNA synthetase
LCINFGAEEARHSFSLINTIRDAGINAELYPEPAKLNKQMNYANNKQIPYVLIVGSEEINTGLYTLKYMNTGEQLKLPLAEIIKELKSQG